MNALLGQVEDLSKAIEGLALDASAAPSLPDPEDGTVALLTRQRQAMLDVALHALEIERLFALLAGWKMPDDDLDVLVAAFFGNPPPVIAVDAAEVPWGKLPHLDW